ncbi:MAG TPA: hypothetical protein VNT79_14525, partial [Phycisphaerae bacterium]|nr:hypothetical protein [Phycisphaerae bacterium]
MKQKHSGNNPLFLFLLTALVAMGLNRNSVAQYPQDGWTGITTIPYTISSSGSYYLTGTAGSATSGITITADRVTLDLNGKTLAGGTGTGISAGSTATDIVIRNGVIWNWDGDGIKLDGENCVVSDVRVTDAATGGMAVGRNGSMLRCLVYDTDGIAFEFQGESGQAIECGAALCGTGFATTVSGSSDIGHSFTTCVVYFASTAGFDLQNNNTVENCQTSLGGAFEMGNGNVVTNCSSKGSDYGFETETGCVLQNCTTEANSDSGFFLGSSSTLLNCNSRDNSVYGFNVGAASTFQNCAAYLNGDHG